MSNPPVSERVERILSGPEGRLVALGMAAVVAAAGVFVIMHSSTLLVNILFAAAIVLALGGITGSGMIYLRAWQSFGPMVVRVLIAIIFARYIGLPGAGWIAEVMRRRDTLMMNDWIKLLYGGLFVVFALLICAMVARDYRSGLRVDATRPVK